MRFGVVHRLMTNALAALGVLALVSSGQFSTGVNVAILVGLAAALSVRESWQTHPAFRHVDTITLVVIIAVQVTRFVLGASGLDVLIEFATALQLVRLATRRGAAHDQQVIVLALLHLIAGTVLGGGLGYGLCFAGVLVVAPGALVLSHLRREVEGNYRQGARDRTGLPVDVPRILRSRRVVGRTFLATMCLLSVPIFVFTAILFVFFPRVGLSLLMLNRQPQGRMIGFSPKVDLGQVGVLREDRTVAMRVTLPNQGENPPVQVALHLRGTALDDYDGRAWSQSDGQRRPDPMGGGLVLLEPPKIPRATDPVMKVDLEAIDPPVLFFPPDAVAIRFGEQPTIATGPQTYALRGPEGEFRYQAADLRGVDYEVFLDPERDPTFERIDPSDRARYLQLPDDLPVRIRELAAEWTAEARSPMDKASAIEAKLREGYAYDRNSPSGRAKQPLDHFLFESKRGHCEYFSTALAVMLRAVDVPTRNVTGFIGGTYNRFGGFYVVRQGDAHSWVEAYVEGRGWVTLDATPAAGSAPQGATSGPWAVVVDLLEATSQRWNRHVVGYDLEQQYGLLRGLSPAHADEPGRVTGMSRRNQLVTAGVVLLVVAGVGFWLKRRRATDPEPRAQESARSRSMVRATAIYESLENALGHHGVHRAPGTPPLRHAENLLASEHPLGRETLDITQVYLSVRFGHMLLSEDVASELDRRVRTLRQRDLRKEARAGAEQGA